PPWSGLSHQPQSVARCRGEVFGPLVAVLLDAHRLQARRGQLVLVSAVVRVVAPTAIGGPVQTRSLDNRTDLRVMQGARGHRPGRPARNSRTGDQTATASSTTRPAEQSRPTRVPR